MSLDVRPQYGDRQIFLVRAGALEGVVDGSGLARPRASPCPAAGDLDTSAGESLGVAQLADTGNLGGPVTWDSGVCLQVRRPDVRSLGQLHRQVVLDTSDGAQFGGRSPVPAVVYDQPVCGEPVVWAAVEDVIDSNRCFSVCHALRFSATAVHAC